MDERWYYTSQEVALMLGNHTSVFTKTVHERPEAVPWSVVICGSHVRHPRTEVDKYLDEWGIPGGIKASKTTNTP